MKIMSKRQVGEGNMYTGKKLQLEQGQKTESQGRANSKYETIQKSLVSARQRRHQGKSDRFLELLQTSHMQREPDT